MAIILKNNVQMLRILFVTFLVLGITLGSYGSTFAGGADHKDGDNKHETNGTWGEFPENPSVVFCHKDDEPEEAPFVPTVLSAHQMFHGYHMNDGVRDIIPPFDWDFGNHPNFGFGSSGSHPGTNWNGEESQQFIDDGCEIPTEPETGSINGFKWNDEDGDGERGEEGTLSGWSIELYQDDSLLGSTSTDENGEYWFTDLIPGVYSVCEVQQEGWSQTAPDGCYQIEVGVEGGEFLGNDFGNHQTDDQEEVDVCANIDGVQTEVPEGYHLENEDQCIEDAPTSSTPPSSGGGGGGGVKIELSEKEPVPEVAGASDVACGMYLFDYMRKDLVNDQFEVTKLQAFLTGQGLFTPLTGVFDVATDKNVHTYQSTYISEIIKPWVDEGIMSELHSTGYVYQTTRWFINNVVCPGSEEFPTPLI